MQEAAHRMANQNRNRYCSIHTVMWNDHEESSHDLPLTVCKHARILRVTADFDNW